MRTNRLLLVLALTAVLLAAFAVYRSYTPNQHLNVEPHAAEEIEKAKHR